jgi:hypothetical protein
VAVAIIVSDRWIDDPVVGPETVVRLGTIGISRVSVLQDATGTGVILEGWAFDPRQIDDAVRALFPGQGDLRIFREIARVAVNPI